MFITDQMEILWNLYYGYSANAECSKAYQPTASSSPSRCQLHWFWASLYKLLWIAGLLSFGCFPGQTVLQCCSRRMYATNLSRPTYDRLSRGLTRSVQLECSRSQLLPTLRYNLRGQMVTQ